MLQVAGATPARLALLNATEHALLALVGAATGVLVARPVAPRIAQSAATVFGSVSPRLSPGDVVGVGRAAVVVSILVSASSSSTLVLGLKDIATRRGRAVVTVLSVTLAVTIAVAIIGLGTSELNPAIAPTQAAQLPADRAGISRLPVFSAAVSDQAIGRIMTLITALQPPLGGVALITLLAAASMSIRERLRELGVLHALGCTTGQLALGCTTGQLAGASAVSQGTLGSIGSLLGIPLGLWACTCSSSHGRRRLHRLPTAAGHPPHRPGGHCHRVAAGAIPALLAQRVPASQALAAE